MIVRKRKLIIGLTLALSAFQCAGAEDAEPQYQYLTYDQLLHVSGQVKTSTSDDKEQSLRVEIIRDEAEELGISHAYAATMQEFMDTLESKSELMNSLFPFEYLTNIAGDLNVTEARFIRPGIVDKVTNSAEVTDKKVIVVKTEDTTYQLREQPRPVLRAPHWTDYFYDNNKIELYQISPELLPRNAVERAAYEDGINRGWNMGLEQAEVEMRTRLANAYRDCVGMVRYMNLIESGVIEKPTAIVENIGSAVKGDQLAIGTKYVYLDGDAEWNKQYKEYNSPHLDTRGSVRQQIRSMIAKGILTEQDIRDSFIFLPEQK